MLKTGTLTNAMAFVYYLVMVSSFPSSIKAQNWPKRGFSNVEDIRGLDLAFDHHCSEVLSINHPTEGRPCSCEPSFVCSFRLACMSASNCLAWWKCLCLLRVIVMSAFRKAYQKELEHRPASDCCKGASSRILQQHQMLTSSALFCS